MEIPGYIQSVDEWIAGNMAVDHNNIYDTIINQIKRYKKISSDTKVLEVGVGTGWFPILCERNGISCEGLEICPQLVDHARKLSKQFGIDAKIRLGNVEDTDLGKENYDVIIAASVFEHVEYWQAGLKNVYRALKPGGILWFESTNKFSPISGEFNLPLYGWLPDRVRYQIRIWDRGPEIMQLGVDFNQFTYCGLEKFFKDLGFSRVLDLIEFAEIDDIQSRRKRQIFAIFKRYKSFKKIFRIFLPGTKFLCIK